MNHHRRSIRLTDYDYTQNGAYFVTICTHQRQCLFGDVIDGEIVLNAWGQVVIEEWEQTAIVRPNIELDSFVVMPNHIHGILVIIESVNVGAQCIAPLQPKRGATLNNVPPNSLGAIIRGFKAAVTRQIHRLPNPPDDPIWQRNYYEHIIRSEKSLNALRAYVAHNPARWIDDPLFEIS